VFSLDRLWRPVQDVARRVIEDQAGQLGATVRENAYPLVESATPSAERLRRFLSAVHETPIWQTAARAIDEVVAPPLLDVAQVAVQRLGDQRGQLRLAIETPHYFRKALTAALKTAAQEANPQLELIALDHVTPENTLHLAAAELGYERLPSLWR
jgi:hypothetical protein